MKIHCAEESLRSSLQSALSQLGHSGRSFDLVTFDGDLAEDDCPLCVVAREKLPVRAQVFVLVAEASSPAMDLRNSFEYGFLWTLSPSFELDEVSKLVHCLELSKERTRTFELIVGPVAHDINGAMGVVDLVGQVLQNDEARRPLSVKLRASKVKLQALLLDLRTLTAPGFWTASDPSSRPREPQPWISMTDIETFLDAAHRGRTMSVDHEHHEKVMGDYGGLITRALVDVAARLSARDQLIRLSVEESKLVVSLDRIELGETQMAALLDATPSWTDVGLPFRWTLARQAARITGGEVRAERVESGLRLLYAFSSASSS